MNKSRIRLVGLLMVVLLLALAVPAQAKKAANFYVDFDLPAVDMDHYIAVGTYSISCDLLDPAAIEGKGTATMHWAPKGHAKQGTLVLEDDDDESSLVIQFTWSGDAVGDTSCITNPFMVVGVESEGDYDIWAGHGTMHTCATFDEDGVLNWLGGTMDGWAEPVPY